MKRLIGSVAIGLLLPLSNESTASSLCFENEGCLLTGCESPSYGYGARYPAIGFTTDANVPCSTLSEGPWVTLSESASDPFATVSATGELPSYLYVWLTGHPEPKWYVGVGSTRVAGDISVVGAESITDWAFYYHPLGFLEFWYPVENCQLVAPQLIGRLVLQLPTSLQSGSWGFVKALYR